MTHLSTFKTDVENDIWVWVKSFIEVNNEFYNYKFPPCPYAKSARLKGLMDVTAYTSGDVALFINQQTEDLITGNKFNVRVLVFPAYMRWFFHIHYHVRRLNTSIVQRDFYAQYGKAVKTHSRYSGIFKNQPYFIVIINRLSDVLSGHQSLLATNYYAQWSKKHYHDVVVRRDKMYEKYNKEK
jgi:hypothetical protein